MLEEAKKLFPDVNITEEGQRYLGSFIGTEAGKKNFVELKVDSWMKEVEELSLMAKRMPQLVYSGYIFGLSKRWYYLCRTTPDVSLEMKKLEHTIKEVFIPAIIDRAHGCTDQVREIFSLPAREGGMGIYNLSETSDMEYRFSMRAT